jgi:hypothetical protein
MQVAYYNMNNQTAEGVTFLNNMGGQGSGVWDKLFGSSLSYAAADAHAGATTSQIFNGELKSQGDVAIFSSTGCKTADCGFVRPGSVAYRKSQRRNVRCALTIIAEGFAGDQKAFFFEFQMPDDGTSGSNMNMPSIWGLNAQIPRTHQYGSCSCWASSCGELDIFETLDSGNTKDVLRGESRIAE